MLRKTGTGLAVAGLLAGGLALSGGTAHAADPVPVQLPISHYSHMLVDGVHKHLFISEGVSDSAILVTDFDGQTVTTINNEPGADGMALSPDGSTVYAALTNADAVSAISTTDLAETTRYSLGAGSAPHSIAVTGGKVWVSYKAGSRGDIASIDPSTSPATIALGQTGAEWEWYSAPLLVASPGAPGTLLATDDDSEPPYLERYDVSSGAAVKAVRTWLSQTGVVGSLQITPDGRDVVIAAFSPYHHQAFKLSDLSPDGSYGSTSYPNSVAIAPDGYVAAGSNAAYSDDVYVYAPRGSSPLNTYDFGYATPTLLTDGLVWAPDGSRLFAIASGMQLHVLMNPEVGASSLTLTGPATATRNAQLQLTGTLSSAGPVPSGAILQVKRIDAAHPNGVALPNVVASANGSFAIKDTPPIGGANSYQVSFAGSSKLRPSTAEKTVQVSRISTALSLTASGAGSFLYGAWTTVTAHLGTTYNGRTVTILETAGGHPATILKSGTVDAHGNLVADAKLTYNTTFTASFSGDYRYAPASASKRVYTHAAVSERQSGYYASGSVSGYAVKYFHHTAHPALYATISPNKAGGCAQFRLQEYYYSGSWLTVSNTGCFTISANSVAEALVTLGSGSSGHLFRIAAEYVSGSNTTNLTTWGGWQYFYVKA